MSTRPSAIACRSAAVNTPTPNVAIGSAERSPSVLTFTSSAAWPFAVNASLMAPAWVVANKLPLVPIRIVKRYPVS